ncbi:DUF952 domain-containing protein [Amaricoccus tamworthensis]|uniref:DUF952 domain-containing protein n=1 Tax=Amaricoccus tamworthensis TaxID=57002 RepID=UPI003C7CBCAF
MRIYKVFRAREWAELEQDGSTPGAPVDRQDGYVHFSTARQLDETLRKHFSNETELFLLTVDAEALGNDIRWEPSRGGDLFPHLYRELRLSDILSAEELATGPDGPQAPIGLT